MTTTAPTSSDIRPIVGLVGGPSVPTSYAIFDLSYVVTTNSGRKIRQQSSLTGINKHTNHHLYLSIVENITNKTAFGKVVNST